MIKRGFSKRIGTLFEPFFIGNLREVNKPFAYFCQTHDQKTLIGINGHL